MRKEVKGIILLVAFFMLIAPLSVRAAQKSDYEAVFNAQYYYNQYPDLQIAVGSDENSLFTHFLTCGIREGRIAKKEFNVRAYIENNKDLQSVFGKENFAAYYQHYIQYGKQEGRVATGLVKKEEKEDEKKEEEIITGELIATYSTSYKKKTKRAHNIELSTARINQMIIQPGETFSFSNSIMSRTKENGYVSAASFLNKKVVDSIGGGICQVSSTIYAALKSYGIPALERHAHSLPVDYLPVGYDATVAEGIKDLRFVNNYTYPIQLQTTAKDGIVTISIYK